MESGSRSFDSSGDLDTRLTEMNINNVSTQTETAGASHPSKSCKVAVIGAGAAGLAAARELIREGHNVTVFEQTSRVGGLWVYDPNTEDDDLLGSHPTRKRVHSSVYASLRTNVPRELMGYTDFPFLPRSDRDGRDGRRFPGHAEVAAYLEDFARFYNLLDVVKFCTVVEDVRFCKRGDAMVWNVRTRRRDLSESDGGVHEAEFDAVVVCNGHYSEPKLADSPDLSKWPGMHMHSHNYREPSSFHGQIVVVIGNGSSARDISREIAKVAKEVHISGRTWNPSVDFSQPRGQHGNIWLHSMIECVCDDGTLKFRSGGSVSADIIMHCTGYSYYFPFLHTQREVGVDDNCVVPLYEHVFPPSLAPSLAFIGIPWKVAGIFRMCELQSRWVAMALSRKINLPTPQEMMNSVQNFYVELEASGKAKCLAHFLAHTQYNYDNWLADQTGSAHIETWRIKIDESYLTFRRENPESTPQDMCLDKELLQEAHACLEKMHVKLRCSLGAVDYNRIYP